MTRSIESEDLRESRGVAGARIKHCPGVVLARPLLELIKQSRHVVHRLVLPELAARKPKVGTIVTFA